MQPCVWIYSVTNLCSSQDSHKNTVGMLVACTVLAWLQGVIEVCIQFQVALQFKNLGEFRYK